MRRWILALGLALATAAPAAAKIQAVASFSILADMVAEVGGDAVDVHSLVGPDGDVHAYQATPQDVKTLRDADIVVLNGLGLEGWMERLSAAAHYDGVVVTASAGLPVHEMEEDGHSVADPHAWQSLANAQIYVGNIADGLCAADRSHCADFRQRAEAYRAQLAALDSELKAAFAKIPPERRVVVTTHDAFAYFGQAYGVTFLAPEGISTEAEPTAAGLAALVRQVRATKVSALFFENMADNRLMTAIAADTGARLGETLYADALAPPGAEAATYLGLFQHNARVLLAAMTAQ